MILSIGSGQKEFLRVQSNQESSFFKRTWNLYLREIIFATYVGVLTIETFFSWKEMLVFKPVFLKQFRQFHFLKPLDIFYEAFEIRQKGTSAKKVTLGK